MRKFADVVIRMQQNSNYILLYPSQINWEEFAQQKVDEPFSDSVIEYLNALSSSLLKDCDSRLYPDVVTFAFFCRKANLQRLKMQLVDDKVRLGRGILFHIAPGNVPVNFGYTFVAGLLAGNNNIVRISSKEFPQVDMIIKHIHELEKHSAYAEVAKRLALVKYDRTSDASAFFSSIANVRVIWGGDAQLQLFVNMKYLLDHLMFVLQTDILLLYFNRKQLWRHQIVNYQNWQRIFIMILIFLIKMHAVLRIYSFGKKSIA